MHLVDETAELSRRANVAAERLETLHDQLFGARDKPTPEKPEGSLPINIPRIPNVYENLHAIRRALVEIETMTQQLREGFGIDEPSQAPKTGPGEYDARAFR